MSYVIQNFFQPSRNITITPKFKLLNFLNNINLFLLFFKLNIFSGFLNFGSNRSLNFFYIFNKYFFSFYILKLIKKSNQKILSVYTNNFFLSILFYNYKIIKNHLSSGFIFFNQLIPFKNYYFFNLYFLSVKLVKVNVIKKFYKNIFFFFLLLWPSLWFQHNPYFKFSLNFFFCTSTIQIFKFYNGPFFKVYNF